MTFNFDPVGRAVDSGRVQKALGLSRAHLHALVTDSYNYGIGATLPRPAGILGGSMVWEVRELEAALPAFQEARQHVVRNGARTGREPVSTDTLAAQREDHYGVPHLLGLMDADMIAMHFKLGDNGARFPGEWSARGKLLPDPVGVLGTRRVWSVEDVKARKERILTHLTRRKELAQHR